LYSSNVAWEWAGSVPVEHRDHDAQEPADRLISGTRHISLLRQPGADER
jgi:hypothetical protein